MKNCLKKYSIKIMQLGIKNKLLFHPAKLNNILDIDLNKISVDNIINDDDLGIYYVKYNNNIFYLVIDNIKGYFEKTNNDNYLMFLIVRHLFGRVEKIQGSNDRYLVVDENNKEVINVFDKLWKFIEDEINRLIKRNYKITFSNADNKISEYKKLTFSSDVDLPLDTLIEFHMLTIVINCFIEKGNKYYPEIYLDEC